MRIPSPFRRIFRLGAYRPDPDGDLDEELRFHFARTEEELQDLGLSPAQAREESHRRFGDLGRYRKELHRLGHRRAESIRRRDRLQAGMQTLVQILRGLGRTPGFSMAVVLTLALGIGANAVMFGVVDHLLLSDPAHVVEADQVVRIQVRRSSPFTGEPAVMGTMTWVDYQAYLGAGTFESVAAFGDDPLILGRGDEAIRVSAGFVTGSLFPLLGVQPALGRFFDESEDQPGGPAVVVLSHGLWKSRFGGSPEVLGQNIALGEGVSTIVGVAPRGFNGVRLEPLDLYLPVHAYSIQAQSGSDAWMSHPGFYWLQAIARLAPGASREAAALEATTLHLNGRRELIEGGRYPADAQVVLGSAKPALGPDAPEEVRVARWLGGVTLIVLLIACANVANLLLARGTRRRRELGIRVALGISGRRLMWQLLLESVTLAVLGGAVGLGLAYWGGDLLRALVLPDVAWRSESVNPRVLLFTLGAAGSAGILAGLAPALRGARGEVLSALKDGGWGGTGRRPRSQSLLLVAQTALSVILLVGAGLFVRSLHQVRDVDLGLDPEGLILVEPDLEGQWDGPGLLDLARRATERLEGMPGVESASFASGIPFWSMSAWGVYLPGLDSLPVPQGMGPFLTVSSANHLSTLGIRLLEGRMYTERDAADGARVLVVSSNMARGLWGQESALGRCLILSEKDSPCWEVIGVVETSKLSEVTEEERWQYFLPFGGPALERGMRPSALFVRAARGEAGELLGPIRRELQALDPRIRFVYAHPLQDLIDPGLRSWLLGASMFSLFGILALVVAMVGLYSVLAFTVARRTRELGVRSALGADRARLLRMVLGEAVMVTGVGIVVGLALAAVAAKGLGPLLFDTSPWDPNVFVGVGGILLAVGLAAGTIPALAAARVEPMGALRAE